MVTSRAREREKREKRRDSPSASMGGLPRMGLSPGVVLVPGVGASLRGVGVLDFRPGVEDLSFCREQSERIRGVTRTHRERERERERKTFKILPKDKKTKKKKMKAASRQKI